MTTKTVCVLEFEFDRQIRRGLEIKRHNLVFESNPTLAAVAAAADAEVAATLTDAEMAELIKAMAAAAVQETGRMLTLGLLECGSLPAATITCENVAAWGGDVHQGTLTAYRAVLVHPADVQEGN